MSINNKTTKAMKIKRFDFNFRPLQVDISFTTSGSIPNRQNYDAATGEYTPDFTLTPLIIQPEVSVIDKDEVLQAGRVNQSLTNIAWYEIDNGTRTLIAAANENYEMTTSGSNAGRIKVKRNATVNTVLTLEFNAQYVDPRTNQIHTIQKTYPVYCDNATVGFPELFLDAADQTLYNPLVHEDTQVVKASLKLGGNEVLAARRIFVWEKYRSDGSWTQVGTDETLDYDVTVANDGLSVTVDRSKMGSELYLRCRAKYDVYGNPASVTLTDGSPSKVISFIRRIPKFEFDIAGVPTNIPEIVSIAPNASIWDVNGPIDNPERELLPLWYVATNKASGSLSYTQVGHGVSPVLPTKAMSQQYGAVFGLDVKDCGPTCAMEDSDGKVFTDSDGKILLFK